MMDEAKGRPDMDDETFQRLIEESSLGTPGAAALRKRTEQSRVDALWQRLGESERSQRRRQVSVGRPRFNDGVPSAGTVLSLDEDGWGVVAPLPGGSGGFGRVSRVTNPAR